MKIITHSILCQCCLLALVIGIGSTLAAAEECDGHYFTIDQYGQEHPSRRPDKRFSETLQKAKDGVSIEQRNLAVSYGSGYLVSKCFEKSVYWYRKAADSGDDIAQQWLIKNKSILSMQAGSECAGEFCLGSSSDEKSVAILYPNTNKNGHFFALITINGHTAQGMIDTGASTVAMSPETAKTFGINSAGGLAGRSSTANGTIATTSVTVPLIDVAGIKARNVRVSIGITGDTPLIGMSFLRQVNVSMDSGAFVMSKRQ